ncbi:MAG: sulfatase-like hydrolase/transferase [Bacteroidales bacterium]|jgi:phosphoglycerol transferase MdoB-like AlkP superfamily enzyme|nr:sulfatase-like hydrolase/transferase [Bacteroidales bacterium]
MSHISHFTSFFLRLLFLYVLFFAAQIVFYFYNNALIDSIPIDELWNLIKGAFVFNSVSIFYINLPFVVFSFIPLGIIARQGYQKFVAIWFTVTNALALMLHIADIFYYPFKLGRISNDDLHYFGAENNVQLLGAFFLDYWFAFVAFALLVWVLYCFARLTIPRFTPPFSWKYYVSNVFALLVVGTFAVYMIRGGNFSASTRPIHVSDVTIYAKNPTHSSLILSNPFCLLRTLGTTVRYETYFETQEELQSYFNPVQTIDTECARYYRINEHTNIVFIILESFGAAHLRQLNAEHNYSYTPFLDSLMNEGLLFTNAFHNGKRSMDALPSIWASIPSFKEEFLSLPQSVAPLNPLPRMLANKGYTTAFLHGALHSSMGFVAFGNASGVQQFFCREEYEKERGTHDFDGKWGIWDHAFLPFAQEKISTLKEPFLATIFTLSSHHPFTLPPDFEKILKGGTLPIYRTLQYSDAALRDFFIQARKQPWFANTLFIITADHGSGQEHTEWSQVPRNFAVPVLFYKENSNFRGTNNNVMGHIDIMPTVLGMMQHTEAFFAFGKDVFALKNPENHVTVNYYGGYFNFIKRNNTFLFNEKEISAVYPTQWKTDTSTLRLPRAKAFIQSYYQAIEKRKFVP